MTTLADVIEHQDACSACTGDTPCDEAERMFAEARSAVVARFEPPRARAFELLDLHAHRLGCTRCTPHRLCSAGRAITDRAGSAIRDTGRRMERA